MMLYLMLPACFYFHLPPPLFPFPNKNNSCNCQASAALFIKVNIYYIFVSFFFFFGILLLLARSCSRLCRLGVVWRFVCIVIDTLSLVRSALQYHCRPTRRIRNAPDTARMAHCALRIAPHRSAEI